jgi:ankyrin repeat protein
MYAHVSSCCVLQAPDASMDDVMGAPYDEMLHEAEAQLEATDAAGDTPLATAIKHGQVDAVRQLIELGCDINAVMGDSRSCLMIASDLGPEHHDRGSIVSALLDAGAAVDARDDAGRTALMFAARGDPLDAVTALIHAGADVNAATEAGVTSLMYACCYTCDNCCVSLACDTAVVGALLAAGADVHAEDEDGRTAIFAAANVGAADLVEQLVNAGGPHTLNKQATDGSTALLYATLPPFSPLPHANHAAVVACLLRLGTAALAWVHDVLGNTPLHSAIMNHCSTNIIQQLLDHGAPREARIIGSGEHEFFMKNQITTILW